MEKNLIKKIITENVLKNILVIIIALMSWPTIETMLKTVDAGSFGNLLLIISILLVTVCFANFAFTYQNSNVRSLSVRILSHAATFLFLLLTALLLEATAIGVGIVYPSVYPLIATFSILLYTSIVLYDFWDIFRIK